MDNIDVSSGDLLKYPTSFPFKTIDLTHTVNENIPTWNMTHPYDVVNKVDYTDNPVWPFRTQHLSIRAGAGTHIDVPSHCFEGRENVDQMKLENMIVPAIVIDISKKADENYSLTVDDIKAWETIHGDVPKNSHVIVYTGWDRYWNEPEKFHNDYVFPSVTGEAAEYLLKKDIAGIGIDTLSADRKRDGFPVHKAILGAGKYLIENIANAGSLPPKGFYTWALPIRIANATEAPIRLVAMFLESPNK